MKFEDMIKYGLIRRTIPNEGMIISHIQNAEKNLRYLRSSKIDEYSSRIITTGYYDILRTLIESFVLSEGYRVSTHESLKYYLKIKGDSILANKFDRLRALRNGIQYYAKDVSPQKAIETKKEVGELIAEVKKKYLSKYDVVNNDK